MTKPDYPVTPDGRYFVAKNRLWCCTNPDLTDSERRTYVKELMDARRAVKHASNEADLRAARAAVQRAKEYLGERGPVWWDDGAEDVTQHHPKNTEYADWWAEISANR